MKYPNFEEEKRLWKKGYETVVGLDEAGRGPLAGPVVAAAVAVNPKSKISKPNQNPSPKNLKLFRALQNRDLVGSSDLGIEFSEVKDSKKMSAKKRELVYTELVKCKNIAWGVGIVSEKLIDKMNILQATKLAMQKALLDLPLRADYLLIDGNFKLSKIKTPQKAIIRGDQKVFSIALASIIAKVTRDRLMQKYHGKYPQYGFDKHKGYGTKAHFASLEKFGPCEIHRKTFFPVSEFLQRK